MSDDLIKVSISGRAVTKAVKQSFGGIVMEKVAALAEKHLNEVVKEEVDKKIDSWIFNLVHSKLSKYSTSREEDVVKMIDKYMDKSVQSLIKKEIEKQVKLATEEALSQMLISKRKKD